jgi:hypothetical protein
MEACGKMASPRATHAIDGTRRPGLRVCGSGAAAKCDGDAVRRRAVSSVTVTIRGQRQPCSPAAPGAYKAVCTRKGLPAVMTRLVVHSDRQTPYSAGSRPRLTAATSRSWSRSIWSAYRRANRANARSAFSELPRYPAIIEAPLVRE